MKKEEITKSAYARIPLYLCYLRSVRQEKKCVSSRSIAAALGLGDVLVRKDLAKICQMGKPKMGRDTESLIAVMEEYLRSGLKRNAILIGAGRLGKALLDCNSFSEHGIDILAGFDIGVAEQTRTVGGTPILPMGELEHFCGCNNVHLGIITVPGDAAQEVCERLIQNQITTIWSFAPVFLTVPDDVTVKYENLAVSLAQLGGRP